MIAIGGIVIGVSAILLVAYAAIRIAFTDIKYSP